MRTQTTSTAAAGLFDALTDDELFALMDALVTRRGPGMVQFSASRMAATIAGVADWTGEGAELYHAYRDLAREIGHLHSEVCDRYIARMSDEGPAGV